MAAPAETVDSFYAGRGNQLLWLRPGPDGIESRLLVDLLRSADADGRNPQSYPLNALDRALRSARSGDAEDMLRADRMLSHAFVAYVRDLKRSQLNEMIWVDPGLRPASQTERAILEAAAAAPSLPGYLAAMGWMNPIYSGLRNAIAKNAANPAERDLLLLNLERARLLPASGRYIIVNAAEARLTMYEDGQAIDSMKVVVGKPIYPTPMMAALIRFVSLNPYWYVPPDLAAERVAPGVVKSGIGFLKAKGYQVLASWDPDATVIDPTTIDWPAVAAGTKEVRIRQLPGPSNSMGKMKFMFPNAQGVYLHDTPEKELLSEASRMFSGGCVRLEDAPRLAKWLFDGNLPSSRTSAPEQRIDLPRPVPVYLTYLTAIPTAEGVTYLPDVYKRDAPALAAMTGDRSFASR